MNRVHINEKDVDSIFDLWWFVDERGRGFKMIMKEGFLQIYMKRAILVLL